MSRLSAVFVPSFRFSTKRELELEMSSSRSKSKDKKAAGKEPLKPSTKPATSPNIGGGAPSSAYNPLLGTFHSLETAPGSSVPHVHVNGRFRDIDGTDDPGGNSVGTGVEYDCVSNNGSWSGESEDPKDKPFQGLTSRQEAGPGVDSDKREKIRQKNEKKHQRQKERRAHELHERCCGFLISRKLDGLAEQLVAMGFPLERATMALIANEGKLEESVAWLFEGGEDSVNQKEPKSDHGGGGNNNLKVDISQELAQIADMETKFKCSKQEVERVVVACEGDLEKAAENLLKFQKQESNAAPPKLAETSVPFKPPGGIMQMSTASQVQVQQSKQNPSSGALNFPTMSVTSGRSLAEPGGGKNIQLLKKVPPAPSLEKRWAIGGLSSSGSYSLASSLQAAPPLSKTETQYAGVGNEIKNLQIGSVREPVIMMQRAQSKHIPATSMSSSSSSSSGSYVADWTSNGVIEPVAGMNPNAFHTTRNFNSNTPSYRGNQLYDQFHYQPRHVSSSGPMNHHGGQPPVATNHLNNNNGLWNNRTVGSTPQLAAATSLGLFSGFGSNGISGSSQVDWNGDWPSQFDYTNIDWSLNRPAGNAFIPNGLWMGSGSSPGRSAVRPASSVGGLHHPDGVGGGSEASGGGSREWTSPFEEKDLFSLPQQFVSSPSL
ncbi:hypothetical protein L1987_38543 [Smallanthus sonchifolius]|uniref:Uncharacterized protein n=1 Tax=Smallanthus sonchifolius TaxID=185202 RepID=A0ACB9HKE3_9ASTR|nr:hypothetical protein L1987_38543 [Smallanthus sonchifolius]